MRSLNARYPHYAEDAIISNDVVSWGELDSSQPDEIAFHVVVSKVANVLFKMSFIGTK